MSRRDALNRLHRKGNRWFASCQFRSLLRSTPFWDVSSMVRGDCPRMTLIRKGHVNTPRLDLALAIAWTVALTMGS